MVGPEKVKWPPSVKWAPRALIAPEPLPSLICHVFTLVNVHQFSSEVTAALGLPRRGIFGSSECVVGAQTCGVDSSGLTPRTGAAHVEGSHIDGVALPGLQLHQALAGRDAHNRPG